MDAFEQVVSEVLWREGFWVRTSVKVELDAADKRKINRSTSPRWELDVVAYRPSDNQLRVVECKSYLNSRGVGSKWLDAVNERAAGRYKLFRDATLRKTVFDRLVVQFDEAGMCLPNPKIKLCLACGKIQQKARDSLTQHFKVNGWELLDEEWLQDRLQNMAEGRYENQVSAVVAKLLRRKSPE